MEVGPAAAPQRRAFGFSKAVKRTSALQAADDASATVPTVPTSTDEQRPPCRIADGDALHHGARDGQNGALSATSDGLRPQEAAPGRWECTEACRCLYQLHVLCVKPSQHRGVMTIAGV